MKAKHSERGASIAETAVVMSVVLLLLFAIVDFGRALYTYSFVATIAREGARWMIVRGSQCTVLDNCGAQSAQLKTYVQGLNNGALSTSSIAATANFVACPSGAAAGNGPGCTVRVTVTYPFAFIAPYFSKLGMTMTSTSQMVISQ